MSMYSQGGVANRNQKPNAGIDVAKQQLDVCIRDNAARMANDADGCDGVVALLCSANVDLVVMEATGGYERGLLCALQTAGVSVARVNRRHQARDFAKSMGVLAKTDQARCAPEPAFIHFAPRREGAPHRRT